MARARVSASWSVHEEYGWAKLKFPWPNGGKGFSYDLGGILHGGDLDKQKFLVECRKYSSDNQGSAFDKFLAQSYVMQKAYPFMANQIMWITWHPFRKKGTREIRQFGLKFESLLTLSSGSRRQAGINASFSSDGSRACAPVPRPSRPDERYESTFCEDR